MSRTNVQEVYIGLQTLNPAVPDHVRANRMDFIRRYLPRLTERGVPWRAELITGLPGDDLEGLKRSMKIVVDELQPATFYAYHLTVIPGTHLTQLLEQFHQKHWLIRDARTNRVLESSSFSRSDLAAMLLYGAALTSLYMYTRSSSKPRLSDSTFDQLDAIVSALMQQCSDEVVDTFVKKGGAAARAFWQRQFETGAVTGSRMMS